MEAEPQRRLKRLLAGSPLAPLALAESCTGGLVAAKVTAIAGSSEYFDRGFVTYTDEAKAELLGVDPELIRKFGAVSEETALAMAQGLLDRTRANIVGAVTGIAGPTGERPGKPVGTVWLAWGTRFSPLNARVFRFDGGRRAVREQSARTLLNLLCEAAVERSG